MKKLVLFVVFAMFMSVGGAALAANGGRTPDPVRFATFNASLNRFDPGDLAQDLADAVGGATDAQLEAVLQIIAINDPDILLINEFDYEPGNAELMAELTGYPYYFAAPSNTGIPSGQDLNDDGFVGGPDDAFGFGFFPGQYGMVVLSKYEITDVRTFQTFLWKDMPGAMLPVNPDGTSFYSDDSLDIFRLSSKSHWDVTIDLGARGLHFLVSHPTPPVFDGPEDRNGTRNFDEIRFWADYISPSTSRYIYDDDGVYGGLTPGSAFVIAGDQNSDPLDGDSIPGAVQQLLESPRINTKVTPSSDGAVEQSALQGGINDTHLSDPAFDTADFADTAPGNLRADYVLPSKQLRIVDAGVFWPLSDDPLFDLVGTFPFPSSDHRLVWIDVTVPGRH